MNQPLHSITDAPVRHSVEQRSRMVRYTIVMSIRLVSFVAAAVIAMVWETWWALVPVAAAAVLPYIAVVNANAGGDRYGAARRADEAPQQLLGTGHEEPEPKQWWEEDDDADEASPATSEVIEGEVATDSAADQAEGEGRS